MSDDDRNQPTERIEPAEPIEAAEPTQPTPDAPQETTMDDDQDTRPIGTSGDTTAERQPWDVDETPHTGRPAQPGPAPAPVSTDVRVGTIVWGLVLAAVGVAFLALAAGFTFDVELAFIAIVALAGVGLVAGAVITAVRRNRHG